MKVIGAGFGRTGTSSLKAALEELGFGPCYHMSEVFVRPGHFELWEAAARGEPIDWHRMFEGYNATLDWPASAFWEQLMEANPDAKVLLSVRDPDRWYESTAETVYYASQLALSRLLVARFLDLVVPVQQRAVRLVNTIVWQGIFGGEFANKAWAVSIFERHVQEVQARVPPERLLVYDVKQGWEPLCAFLGVDVPVDTPFPHLHDSDSVRKIVRRQVIRATVPVIARLALALMLAAATVRLLRRRRLG